MSDDSNVMVCKWKGLEDRFFCKYRDPHEEDPAKRWKKIPGGALPPEFDTKEKAFDFARLWFESEMVARKIGGGADHEDDVAWSKLCDLFVEDVNQRVRGADSSRDGLKKLAAFLRRSNILCSRPVAKHDEGLALAWLRKTLAEPKKGRPDEVRDALTVRNVARVLTEIYRFARRHGHFPQDRLLPTEGDEFKAEISAALREKHKLGAAGRVACPIETARAVANNAGLTALRRILTACTSSPAYGRARRMRFASAITARSTASGSSTYANSSP